MKACTDVLLLWLMQGVVSRIYRDQLNRKNVELSPALSRALARKLGYPDMVRYTVDVTHNPYDSARGENYRNTYRVGDEEFPYGVDWIGPLRLWVWSLPPHLPA